MLGPYAGPEKKGVTPRCSLSRKKGITFRNFGEFVAPEGATEGAPSGYRGVKPFLVANTSKDFPGYNLDIQDQRRADVWIRELGVHSLLNGTDTQGWYSYLDKLGKNNDPEGNFKIEHGLLHIEGKNFGYLATEQTYANYYLKVVFKWGQHQYAPRATGKRDSGILYHFADGIPDKVWPKSIECQVQEGDCGDYWCVDGATTETPNPFLIEWNMKHIPRTENFEHPDGEWNTIEIICNGSQTEHYVNGHLVNSGTNANVTAGKILLQSEGAEVYYKSAELIAY